MHNQSVTKRLLGAGAGMLAATGLVFVGAGEASAAAKAMACDTATVDFYSSLNYSLTSGAVVLESSTWRTDPNAAMDRLTWSYRTNGTVYLAAAAGADSSSQNDVSGASSGVYDFPNVSVYHFGTRTVEVKASAWGGVGSDNSSCGSVWHTVYTP